jgi:hypothetical protein
MIEQESLSMDGITPSICPTGIYRPPQQSPASADAPPRPLPSRGGRSKIIRLLGTFVRTLFRARRRLT